MTNAKACLRGRRLADDAVDAVCQENRIIVHRRQAASHSLVSFPDCLLRLQHLVRLATGILNQQMDEVQFGDDCRRQHERVEIRLTHAA